MLYDRMRRFVGGERRSAIFRFISRGTALLSAADVVGPKHSRFQPHVEILDMWDTSGDGTQVNNKLGEQCCGPKVQGRVY